MVFGKVNLKVAVSYDDIRCNMLCGVLFSKDQKPLSTIFISKLVFIAIILQIPRQAIFSFTRRNCISAILNGNVCCGFLEIKVPCACSAARKM